MSTRQDAVPETELKFELGPDSVERLTGHPLFSNPGRTKSLRAVYFDTPSHALRNAGFSVRVRQSGGKYVQTVKQRTGGQLITRSEWGAEVPSEALDLAELDKTPAGAVLHAEPEAVGPVFSTNVERTTRMWRDGETVVELSLDQGEVSAGDRREPIQELELELKSGDRADLFALARDLTDRAPLTLSFVSKGEKGYRLADHDGLAAIRAEVSAVTPKLTAAEAFQAVASGCLSQIAGNAQLFRRVRSPETLHQLRVGLRRLRAALKAFEPMLEDAEYGAVRDGVKGLAHALDHGRDLDVFIQRVLPTDEEDSDDATVAALRKRLMHAQAAEYEKIVEMIGSEVFMRLLLRIAGWVEVGDWLRLEDPAASRLRAMPAAELGRRMLDRFHDKVLKAGRHFKSLGVDERHALRLRAKRLRYAAEFFGGAFRGGDKRRQRYARAVKDLQNHLGELNDLAMIERRTLQFVGEKSPALAYAAGRLIGQRKSSEAALLAAAAKANDAVRTARPFW